MKRRRKRKPKITVYPRAREEKDVNGRVLPKKTLAQLDKDYA